LIGVFLAVVIGQPLDAVYSTASAPRNFGLDLTVRFPGSWQVLPGEGPHGIVNIVAAGETSRVALWGLPDVLVTKSEGYDGRPEIERFAEPLQMIMRQVIPTNATYGGTGRAMLGGRPTHVMEFRSANGRLAGAVYGFVVKQTVVLLWCECLGDGAVERYEQSRPLFTTIASSIGVSNASGETSWLPTIGISLCTVVVVAVVVHFVRRRKHSSPLPARRTRR
jgi:hypothetical protein